MTRVSNRFQKASALLTTILRAFGRPLYSIAGAGERFLLWVAKPTKWGKKLRDRTLYTEIGVFSGHVSLLDEAVSRDNGLQPLSRFEKKLLGPFIKSEKKRRKNAFRRSCIEVLGEDPEEDWV